MDWRRQINSLYKYTSIGCFLIHVIKLGLPFFFFWGGGGPQKNFFLGGPLKKNFCGGVPKKNFPTFLYSYITAFLLPHSRTHLIHKMWIICPFFYPSLRCLGLLRRSEEAVIFDYIRFWKQGLVLVGVGEESIPEFLVLRDPSDLIIASQIVHSMIQCTMYHWYMVWSSFQTGIDPWEDVVCSVLYCTLTSCRLQAGGHRFWLQ